MARSEEAVWREHRRVRSVLHRVDHGAELRNCYGEGARRRAVDPVLMLAVVSPQTPLALPPVPAAEPILHRVAILFDLVLLLDAEFVVRFDFILAVQGPPQGVGEEGVAYRLWPFRRGVPFRFVHLQFIPGVPELLHEGAAQVVPDAGPDAPPDDEPELL